MMKIWKDLKKIWKISQILGIFNSPLVIPLAIPLSLRLRASPLPPPDQSPPSVARWYRGKTKMMQHCEMPQKCCQYFVWSLSIYRWKLQFWSQFSGHTIFLRRNDVPLFHCFWVTYIAITALELAIHRVSKIHLVYLENSFNQSHLMYITYIYNMYIYIYMYSYINICWPVRKNNYSYCNCHLLNP